MRSGAGKSVRALVALALLSGSAALAGGPIQLTGSVAGIVRDNAGIPQMGATVLLFNRAERIIQRALTNERGAFGFETLSPDVYSVRVSLASFVPAMKSRIAVQPGMQSLLYINMATLLSSVELVYAAPGQGALMSDDWKWTLKTATSTRPVLRLLPDVRLSGPPIPQRTAGAIFSDTRGLLRLSGGDASGGDIMNEPDLGTAFALATSLFGRSRLQVSGDVAHAAGSALPAASFRTSYSHDGVGPEIAVTMRQVYLPSRAAAMVAGQTDALPALRTMSLAMIDRLELSDSIRLEYGMSLDSVSFIDHLNYFSPFARLTYDLGSWGTVRAGYSSGAPPAELFSRTEETESALHQDLTALALSPRVSLHEGDVRVQRTQSFEVGYEKKLGRRTVNLTVFREMVANGALTMYGGENLYASGDVLPDLSSRSGTFDIGSYQRHGYSAAVTQPLGDKLLITASSGRSGALLADSTPLDTANGDDVRSKIRIGERYWASVRATGTLPVSGTQITSSYQWMDSAAMLPAHLYLTQDINQETGFNIHIRQPIPGFPGMPGRVEATADLRNMMAQGYLSLPVAGGSRVLFMQAPRAFRGGLSFIF